MLSFAISAIDIPLLVAIVVLFVLYEGGTRRRESRRKNSVRAQIIRRVPNKARVRTEQVNRKISDCPYRFGYLKASEIKNIPEKCVGCGKLVKCVSPDGILL